VLFPTRLDFYAGCMKRDSYSERQSLQQGRDVLLNFLLFTKTHLVLRSFISWIVSFNINLLICNVICNVLSLSVNTREGCNALVRYILRLTFINIGYIFSIGFAFAFARS